jgi:hypothetical protein
VLVSVLVALSSPAAAQAEAVAVETSPIASFWLASGETRFGPLEFVGGFSMSAEASRFGQFSALRFLNAGSDFIGVADHGFWSFGTILRDADLAPIGIADFTMQPMVDDAGAVIGEKELIDAEGLEVENGVATVSFEREARVSEYTIDPEGMSGPSRNLDFLVPVHELRFNQGLETVVRGADGARIVFSERSIDGEGDIFAAIIEGPGAGVFKVARGDGFDITDGALLPDGDILLLERRFSIELGVAMRLRRIPREEIRAGGLADGPVLMEADLTYQIDNMEALDVWRREDGAIMVSLMSDDNQNFLQRTLYLEFRLTE